MGSTLIKVNMAECPNAFVPATESCNWIYAFFSPGRVAFPASQWEKFWKEYFLEEVLKNDYNTYSDAIMGAMTRWEQEVLGSSRQQWEDFCEGFSLVFISGSSNAGVAAPRIIQQGTTGCIACNDATGKFVNESVMGQQHPIEKPLPALTDAHASIYLDTYTHLQSMQNIGDMAGMSSGYTEQPIFDLTQQLNSADADDYLHNLIEDGNLQEAQIICQLQPSGYQRSTIDYLCQLDDLLFQVKHGGNPAACRQTWNSLLSQYQSHINNNVKNDVFKCAEELRYQLHALLSSSQQRGGGTRGMGGAMQAATGTTSIQTAGTGIDHDYAQARQIVQQGNYQYALNLLKAVKQKMAMENPTTFTMSDLDLLLLQVEENLHIDEVRQALNVQLVAGRANSLYNSYRLNDPTLKVQIDNALQQGGSNGSGFFDKYKYYLLGASGFVIVLIVLLIVLMPMLRESAQPLDPNAVTAVVDEQASDEQPAPEVVPESKPEPIPVAPATERRKQETPRSVTEDSPEVEGPVDTSLNFEQALEQIAQGQRQYIDFALQKCSSTATVYLHSSSDSFEDLGSMKSFLRKVAMQGRMDYQVEQVVKEGGKVSQLILK